MPERIFVAVAWPYVNGPVHLGHIAGCYLPADIFARYHRLKGDEVLMVSGSDQHGTPITIRAEQEGVTPDAVVRRYHHQYLRDWERLGISFDLYTSTGTENHCLLAQDIFTKLLDQGYIYRDTMNQPYCEYDRRFLPDRYVTGVCPLCSYGSARGDQCLQCGKPMNPQELLNLCCRICGHTPIIRGSEHFFLRLSAFQEPLLEWASSKENLWRSNVYNFTRNWLTEGLRDRAFTRDIDWGVPIPLAGYEQKRIYVWFEAVMGYLSATMEWAQKKGEPEAWRRFWQDPACKSYYFIGKDNIPFHTIIWPALLMGYNAGEDGQIQYNLPYDVPANEFLSLEGNKFSTSDNYAVWLPDYLERYDPDPLRYYLSANMPETGDSDFSWREFVRRNNDELVATYGNLVHRVLTFTYRNFEGRVPEPGAYDEADRALRSKADTVFEAVGESLAACHFREAIGSAMGLAHEANRYISTKAPWNMLRENRAGCATALWTTLYVISALKTLLYPFLPFSSQRLHTMLGFSEKLQDDGWVVRPPVTSALLGEPIPLFAKLDDSIVAEEVARLNFQGQ